MAFHIPWKFICILLLLRMYGPEITSTKYHYYATLLRQEYCKDHEDKAQCIVEQVVSFVALANDTYQFYFANLTTLIIEKSGIFIDYFTSSEKRDTSTHKKETVNVSTAMSTLLNQLQQQYKKTLPGDTAKEVMQRLETIAFDREKTDGFCTMKFGLDPSDILKLINSVAELTKMPNSLQNILETMVKVIDADSSIVESREDHVFDGKVHYILIAAYRNANDSFDIALAVFYVDYKISGKPYQAGADQDTLKKLIRFLESDNNNADGRITKNGNNNAVSGRLTKRGIEDLKAHFSGEAYKMFLHKCPAILTGFKKAQGDVMLG